MATRRHPLTGVKLNPIEIERKSLEFEDAVTAHILRCKGVKYATIAHLLGTNPARLGEVFRGECHPAAANEALRLMR